MSKIILAFLLSGSFILSIPYKTFGQKPSRKGVKQYQSAKNLLNAGKYEPAGILFQEVYINPKNYDLRGNALFYKAIAEMKAGNGINAKLYIERLLSEFPAFESKDEALYLLAETQFKNKDIENALKTLDLIKNGAMSADVKGMKGAYLGEASLPTLRNVWQKRDKDTFLAQMIVDKIAVQSIDENEITFMESLIKDLRLEKPATMRFEKKIFTKAVYKIAVLLPFELEKLKNRDSTMLSRASVGLYQGMRIAQNELDTLKGAKVHLYAYEMGKFDNNKLLNLIKNKEFEDIDAFIGPLFDTLHRAIADILPKQKSILINPILTDAKMLVNSRTFLFESTIETQAKKTVAFLQTQQGDNKNIVVLYDDLKKNKNLATLVKQQAEAMGFKVLAFEEVSASDLSPIKTILQKYNRYEMGSMFVASTSNLVAEELVEQLQTEKYEIPVVVPEAWLRIQTIDYEVYEKLKVHILYPDFLDTDAETAPKTLALKKAYANLTHHELPNNNVYPFVGYEMVHHLVKLWQEAGTQTDFSKTLNKLQAYEGKTGEWLDYADKQDNQFVPILKFVKGELVLANKPK